MYTCIFVHSPKIVSDLARLITEINLHNVVGISSNLKKYRREKKIEIIVVFELFLNNIKWTFGEVCGKKMFQKKSSRLGTFTLNVRNSSESFIKIIIIMPRMKYE